jgi:hypothetical protein
MHPFAFADGESYPITDEAFSRENADESLIYRDPDAEGIYLIHRPRGWRRITDSKRYTELIDEARAELESVFGEGSVVGFAWPFGRQKSEKIAEHLVTRGYTNVRMSGCTLDTTSFDIPKDNMAWQCNARHDTFLELARIFEEYPDDGRLKMLSFGVHSADFESSARWDDLRGFSERYGDRPDEFWYATVGEIFAYAEASRSLFVSRNEVKNESAIPLYLCVHGVRHTLMPGESLSLS